MQQISDKKRIINLENLLQGHILWVFFYFFFGKGRFLMEENYR